VELTTPRLRLRRGRAADLDPWLAMSIDPEVTEFLPVRYMRQQADTVMARNNEFIAEHGYGMWAVEVEAVRRSSASAESKTSRSRPRSRRQ
jgi:RimJ/RimL family protein N-acetyltransferase